MTPASKGKILISVTDYFMEVSESDSDSDLHESDSSTELPADLSAEVLDIGQLPTQYV